MEAVVWVTIIKQKETIVKNMIARITIARMYFCRFFSRVCCAE